MDQRDIGVFGTSAPGRRTPRANGTLRYVRSSVRRINGLRGKSKDYSSNSAHPEPIRHASRKVRTVLKTSALAIFAVFVATGGQLLLRAGMESVGYVGSERLSRPLQLVLEVARTPKVVFGLGLFVMSATIWLIVLSRAPLSFAYPFAGLTYVLVTVFAKYALHEHVPSLRWAGIFLIITGIVLVGRTAPPGIQ